MLRGMALCACLHACGGLSFYPSGLCGKICPLWVAPFPAWDPCLYKEGTEQQYVVGTCFQRDGCDQIFQAHPCSIPHDELYPQTEVPSQPLM